MCLLTAMAEKLIAEKDITCYKVITQNMTSLYYKEFKWELGKLYETEMELYTKWHVNIVSQAFHSYETLQDLEYGYFRSEEPCLMVKCTIPKGSEYYLGKHGNENGFASNKIIINEILDVKDVFKDFDWDNYPFKVGQKIITNKGRAIYQIKNIQPSIRNQPKADLIVEYLNYTTLIYAIISTECKNGTWIGVDNELGILEDNKED